MRVEFRRWARLVGGVGVVFTEGLMGGHSDAQVEDWTVALVSAQTRVARLASAQTSTSVPFVIDECENLLFNVTATRPVVVSLETPSGQILGEEDFDSVAGSFVAFDGEAGSGGPSLLVGVGPGHNTVMRLPFLEAGTYRVHLDAGSSLSDEAAVIVRALTDSTLRAGLVATAPVMTLGERAVLAAFVFDQVTPVQGATGSLTVVSPAGSPMEVTLADAGQGADDSSGDGIYTGEFDPITPGTYEVSGTIQGVSTSGSSFERVIAADFEVWSPTVRFVRVVEDRAVDEDGDGVFDRLQLEMELEVLQPGVFQVSADLEAAGGTSVTRNGPALTLTEGTLTTTVSYEGSAISSFTRNGPYDVTAVTIEDLEGAGRIADRQFDVWQTRRYAISRFLPGRPGSISGLVRDDTGAPLENVVIAVYDINGDPVLEVTTDATGYFVTSSVLQPGHYTATTTNALGYEDQIYRNIPCPGACGSPDRSGILIPVQDDVDTRITFNLKP